MKPYSIYFLDFSYRLAYILVSYVICLILIFNNIKVLFLFETYPLLDFLSNQRLILTQITQVFTTVWFLSVSFSTIFVFPLIIYHIKSFMVSSWYSYQLNLYLDLVSSLVSSFILFWIITYLFIIPTMIKFFLYWEITDSYSLLRIEAEIALFYYVIWSTIFKCTISLILTIIYLSAKFFFNFLPLTLLYKIVKSFKKVGLFSFVCLIFIFIPPDFILQFIVIIISYFLSESLFLLICIRIYIKIFNNTTIK